MLIVAKENTHPKSRHCTKNILSSQKNKIEKNKIFKICTWYDDNATCNHPITALRFDALNYTTLDITMQMSRRYQPESTVNMAAKALSLRPSMTLPKWHTSMDMRMPPVASRRMYRHSATMHSHSTPVEKIDLGEGLAKRKKKKKHIHVVGGWTRLSVWEKG